MLRSSSLRISSGVIKIFQRCSTSSPVPTPDKVSEDGHDVESTNDSTSSKKVPKEINIALDKADPDKAAVRSKLVTTAFASLQHFSNLSPLDESIQRAKTPEELLSLSSNTVLTKKQALKIITTLSEWSLNGKGDDFESDPRFVALCQLVSKTSSKNPAAFKEGDLSVVLGVMGEDEAAKMINSITLPQMIKVLSALSVKRRRSIPLLKALAFNISHCAVKLDVKQSADILYAVAHLNFLDEVLLEKVCSDLLDSIPVCKKSAVIGSICTSIGLLRYKDLDLLDCLSSWALENRSISRPQDFVSLLLCLASVNKIPSKEVIDVIISNVMEDDLPSATTWLDVVWSLSVLKASTEFHLSSILSPKFIERLSYTAGSTSSSWKRKLLNINGLAKLTKSYKGPLLKEESDFEVPFTKSKEKQALYSSVVDTLSNLFPSTNHFRTSIDTGMGFLIDAECMFDNKMNPVLLVDKKTGQSIQLNGKRIGILIHDYHDCTRGRVEPGGAASLQEYLLKLAGYNVIPLLYSDYNPHTKLLERAKYLDGLLKSVAALQV